MTHEQIESLVGGYTLRDTWTDAAGREVCVVECADARIRYLREELDDSITGPYSEGEWMNLLAAEPVLDEQVAI